MTTASTRSPLFNHRLPIVFMLMLFGALLNACGGGGGSATVDAGGVKTGGTGAYAAGPISGFGSVIVGGVEFDDSRATVLDDDGAAVGRTGSELRLGMTVDIDGGTLIEGTTTNPNATSVASTIRITSEIVGRVSAVDAAAGTLTVLGQTVKVNAATVLDASTGGSLAALLNRVVEVYALPGATSGSLVATRVEFSTAASFKLRGLVSAVDSATQTLRIGAATLAYGGASGVPTALMLNSVVRVRVLATPSAGGVWTITRFGTAVLTPSDGRDARLEGVATNYAAASASFSVNGVAVDARGVTAPAGLATGVRVEVRGRMSGSTLVATEVKVKTEQQSEGSEFEVKGDIESANAAAQIFVVRGVTIDWSTARFSGGSSALLTVGRRVEVHGVLAADRSRVKATEIDFPGL